MAVPLPPLNLATAATATAGGTVGFGAVTFGAPGGSTTGTTAGGIGREVLVAVLGAVAVFVVLKLIRK